MLRWGLQKASVVIPRSTNAEHIRQNTQLFDFELSPSDVAAIDAMGDGHRVGWDPTKVP
jgi:2,5-diketo-D-gluconate reductase A